MSQVCILLSTYNGQQFLETQLLSLQQQNFQDWTLYVRDDESTDKTREILENFAAKDARIRVLPRDHHRKGAVLSFATLLEHAQDKADYFFFCDQDDQWLPYKVDESLSFLKEVESKAGSSIPLALHTDLSVCDEKLDICLKSMKAGSYSERQDPQPFARLLAQNFVTGCTLLMNRALVKKALPISSHALMHDWWIALVAAATGRLLYLPKSTILYRQHSTNASGTALKRGLMGGVRKFLEKRDELALLMRKRFEQSAALEKHLAQVAPESQALDTLRQYHNSVRAGRKAALTSSVQLGVEMEDSARTLMYRFLLVREQGRLQQALEGR